MTEAGRSEKSPWHRNGKADHRSSTCRKMIRAARLAGCRLSRRGLRDFADPQSSWISTGRRVRSLAFRALKAHPDRGLNKCANAARRPDTNIRR